MGIPFKKILISFFFLFPVIGITVLAETITVHSSAEFSTAMHQLDTSGLNSDISIQSENSDFEQCRLIVITDNELDTYNAENAIYDSDNMYVLFYDSPQAAEEAYKFYINNDEIDVIPDITMTTEDYGSNILSERETTHLSWEQIIYIRMI